MQHCQMIMHIPKFLYQKKNKTSNSDYKLEFRKFLKFQEKRKDKP